MLAALPYSCTDFLALLPGQFAAIPALPTLRKLPGAFETEAAKEHKSR